MRHIPDFVIYLVGFVSTLFFVFYGVHFSSNKSAAIWTLFGGITFGILTGFLYWQNDIWKSEYDDKAQQIQKSETNPERKIKTNVPISKPSVSIQQNKLGDEELMRRKILLTKLRNLYMLSHDGLSPELISGFAPLPKEWTEEQLAKLGETWRQEQYY